MVQRWKNICLWVLLSPTSPPPLVGVLDHIFKAVVTRLTPFQPRGLISESWHPLYKAAVQPAVSIRTFVGPREAYIYAHTRLWLTEFMDHSQGCFLKVNTWTVAFRSPCHTLAAWHRGEDMVFRVTQTCIHSLAGWSWVSHFTHLSLGFSLYCGKMTPTSWYSSEDQKRKYIYKSHNLMSMSSSAPPLSLEGSVA